MEEKFKSALVASVGFKMVEFNETKNVTVEHESQEDELTNYRMAKYDMIIGSDLLWNMGMDILYLTERLK